MIVRKTLQSCSVIFLLLMAACAEQKTHSEADQSVQEQAVSASEQAQGTEIAAQTPREEEPAIDLDAGARFEAALAEGYSHPGEKVYATSCGLCHDQPDQLRVPDLASLKTMSPAKIQFSLKSGKMKAQGEALDRLDLTLLLDYLTPGSAGGGYEVAADQKCTAPDISFDQPYVTAWGVEPDNRRYYGPTRTSLGRKNVSGLELAWVFGLPGTSELRSQPVITEDTLFITTTSGHVFALDRQTACVKWHRELMNPIRTAMTLGQIDGEPVLFFADAGTNVYALEAVSGETVWQERTGIFPESMTTGGLVQHEDKLFVPLSSFDVAAAMNPAHECCKSHGAVVALEAATGERLWLARMMEDATPTTKSSVGTQLWGPSGAPVWTTPAVDAKNGRLYIGTGENTSAPATDTSDAMIALDMETGERLWVFQATTEDKFNMACSPLTGNGPNCPEEPGPDYDFGGGLAFATMSDGREVVIGGQKSGDVHAVDAATGERIWTTKVSSGSPLGGTHWGVSVSNGKVFAPSSDPPYPLPDYEARPGLYVLDLDTGDMLWDSPAERGCTGNFVGQMMNPEPWPECSFFYGYSAAPASTDELVFIGALDGKVRAFDADNGEVLWMFDTKREFETVNNIPAHGGAIDNPGPQLAGDMLFIQSGYAMFSQMPGNALIAFNLPEAE
ncbi:PQQ-binding-like beta-propeller repeat protein [Parvularcula sp. IMCC14364]|uniref:outer membrane protein assembly factor BamB family protein n=1 Tax=Parvularcula sp. IMCC14364 TaxID=3067902 RepID=UPI0027416284|nr:PQQ-binding-like beta-propeller repeat protein [Parvularcula sp. IMCC14364]